MSQHLGDEKMGKDNANSTFDFDNDAEFNANFYKNIEKVLGEDNVDEKEATKDDNSMKENSEITTDGVRYIQKGDYFTDTNTEAEGISIEEAAQELLSTSEATDLDIDDALSGINASLAKQISEELDHLGASQKKELKKHRWFKIQNGILLTLLCLIGFGFFFGFTKPGNQLLMGMGVNLSGKIWDAWTNEFDAPSKVVEDTDYLDAEDLESDAPEVDPNQIVWPQHPGNGRKEEGVYNILLMGEEAIGSGGNRGRTDVIIIATMNTKNETIKLTSLMRDMYVQIPGFQDNKLNTAYEKGGLELMYETIALNFDIQLDGCAMVNFENFEKIIDQLGGLKITLTAGEAKYLNSTNYISNPQYRNVVAGTQLLNGNQVLGYSRVRKRSTITGNNNDYGRTDRHRIVLNAIFDKYKTESKVELASIMLKVLPMIKTDIDSKNFEVLLNTFIEMGTMEMSQLRLPADGTFTDNVKVRGMSVLIPDLKENVDVLHKFIFGDGTATTADSTPATTSNTSAN
jgi:LCP family protein required for cell wall assembly